MPQKRTKTKYTKEELDDFRVIIDKKLAIAKEQLSYYITQLNDLADNPDIKTKGLDEGGASLETERLNQLAARQQKLIQHLENAKIRIHNGVYGICRATGKLISPARLRAVPHATLSIEAKEKGLG